MPEWFLKYLKELNNEQKNELLQYFDTEDWVCSEEIEDILRES